ncbi:MAG: hypothetical protein V4692_12840, partial [Bdellovibrionota bacterium]
MLLVIALAGVLTSFSAHAHDEGFEITTRPRACNRAPAEEVKLVKEGLKKKSAFLKACTSKTGSPEWCNQVASSNPENASILK